MLWRILFIIYAIALTAGTHWPRLDLGRGAGGRSPDKMLHFIAFGALALILWRTKWLRRTWGIVLVAVAWASLDELSQMIGAFERSASWSDWIASASGVLAAGAWMWTLEPVGGPLNRLRLARSERASDSVLGRVGALGQIACGAAMGAIAGMLVVLLVRQLGETPQIDATLLTVLAGAGAGAHWVYVLLHRRDVARINEHQVCFECGRRIEQPNCDREGSGVCPSCGRAFHIGQWAPVVLATIASPLRMVIMPALATLGLMIVGGMVFLLLMRATITVPTVSRVMRTLELNTGEMMLVVDAAYLFIAVAVGARLFRIRLAKVYDRQEKVCAACGHDLRATPANLGIGTCGECGTTFIRIAKPLKPKRLRHVA